MTSRKTAKASAALHRVGHLVDPSRDHIRGGGGPGRPVTVILYGDFLCPYCRRVRRTFARLRETMADRLVYVFRHFPNEEAHPGASLMALGVEAAARQDRFWDMYDALYAREPPLDRKVLLELASQLKLDLGRFEKDLSDPALRRRVAEDLDEGRRRGVTAAPTIFVDGQRYDGAWDYHAMLQGLEQPVGQTLQRTARAFANLPSSAALVLLAAAGLALFLANSPWASAYHALIDAPLAVGWAARPLTLSFGEWCSQGLLALFYLVLGLEIRREIASGSLSDWRAAATPLLAAVGGVVAPALIYLALNPGATAPGWPSPTDTGVAFTLAILALFGDRASASLKAFIAIYAIANDVLSILILAAIHPSALHPLWLAAAGGGVGLLVVLARWRIYAAWPYVLGAAGVWLALQAAGVNGALSGIVLAAVLPPTPAPDPGPLLAQAASALAALEHAQEGPKPAGHRRRLRQEPVWDWTSRNLAAAANRLSAPTDRVERVVEPWSTYVVLPVFAFTAAGVTLAGQLADPNAPRVVVGVALGLALGKPMGVALTSWAAARAGVAVLPKDAPPLRFLAAAILCGMGDPFSLLIADQAFGGGPLAAAAKVGVFAGSFVAAALGAAVFALPAPGRRAPASSATAAAAAASGRPRIFGRSRQGA